LQKIQWLCSTLKLSIFVFGYQERLDGPDMEKSKAAVDYLALADLWENFAKSSAYGLALLVRLLGHTLPLRHPVQPPASPSLDNQMVLVLNIF
jgi:hypothetical protein